MYINVPSSQPPQQPQVLTQWAIILFVTVGQKLKPPVLVQVPREGKAQNQTMGQEKGLNQVVAATHSTKDPAPTTLVNLDTGACCGGTHPQVNCAIGKDKGHFNLYSLAKTPIKYDNLSVELQSYPLEQDRLQLLTGFKSGFSLQYSGPRKFRESHNLNSALEAPVLVES